MLEGVDRLVPERGLPEVRQVPEKEVHRPDGQRDERVGEEAQGSNRPHGQNRTQKRAGQPGDDAERPEVAEQEVLDHVERERLLLAEGRDRRDERNRDERDAEAEQEGAPASHGRAAPRERPGPPGVEQRTDRQRDELERLEGPGRGRRVGEQHRVESRAAVKPVDSSGGGG